MAERQRGLSNFPESHSWQEPEPEDLKPRAWPSRGLGSRQAVRPRSLGQARRVGSPLCPSPPPTAGLPFPSCAELASAGFWLPVSGGGGSSLLRGRHAGTWLLTGNGGGTGFFWSHDAGPSAWGTEAGCTHQAGCRHAQEGVGQPSREWGLHPFPGFQLLALLSLHGLLMPLFSPHCSPQGKSGLLTAERGVSASVSHSLAALCPERVGPLSEE